MSTRQRSPIQPFKLIALEVEHDSEPPESAHQPALIPMAVFQQYVVQSLEALTVGQSELTEAFGKLKPEVDKLKNDALWAQRLKTAGKALVPFAAGALAKYVPGIKDLVPSILEMLQ